MAIDDDEEQRLRSVALQNADAILLARQQAEWELAAERRRSHEAQARLAAIVESSQDAIISKTLDGVIQTWNAGAERLFGYRAEEAVGQSIILLIPPDRQFEEQEILARIARGERIEHYETIRVAKNGRQLYISLTISPVRDAEGRIIGASKVARDVTERREAEEALKEADRRKDEFLALLAHELRNPLAPLRNGLEVMRLASDNAEIVAKSRDMMERQLSLMVRLIDDLLDISRVNRNKMDARRGRAPADGLAAAGADPPDRRPDPALPGFFQSAQQQRQIHGAGWTHLAHRDTGRRSGFGGGPGHRHWHSRRGHVEDLRHVQPGGPAGRAEHRRARHRTGAGQGSGREARRERRGGEPRPRHGQHVHGPAAGSERSIVGIAWH
jgi:PAS domain S-box-containing protein